MMFISKGHSVLLACGSSLILGASCLLNSNASAQGTFGNLGFESANVASLPPGRGAVVPTSDGMPGWTAYYDGVSLTTIDENTVSLAGASISIEGPQYDPSHILLGNFTAYLTGDFNPIPGPHGTNWSSISQTGQVPQTAKSLYFVTQQTYSTVPPIFQVTLGGVSIPITQVGSTSKYLIWAGDITAFSGQTEQLTFTALPGDGGYLDAITFSPLSIPEPTTPALFAAGGLLLAFWMLRRKE